MKLNFQLEYRTTWGESVVAHLVYTTTEGRVITEDVSMTTSDGIIWRGQTNAPIDSQRLDYAYRIMRDDILKREEWTASRHTSERPQCPGTLDQLGQL